MLLQVAKMRFNSFRKRKKFPCQMGRKSGPLTNFDLQFFFCRDEERDNEFCFFLGGGRKRLRLKRGAKRISQSEKGGKKFAFPTIPADGHQISG